QGARVRDGARRRDHYEARPALEGVIRRPARTGRKMADRRLRLVLALSLAAFTVVVFRAAQIQGVDAAALSRKAGSRQRGVEPLPGLRGAILSADGQHLAQEQTSKTSVTDKDRLLH